jgi:hypothetical protein
LYFSKMKKEQELIRSGATVINERDGWRMCLNPYLMSVEDFKIAVL